MDLYVKSVVPGVRNPANRYILLSDGRRIGPFDASSLLACEIRQDELWSEEQLLCIENAERLREAKLLAMNYLGRSRHTELEVRRYLARKELDKEIRDQVLDWLREQKWIDDADLGSYLVQKAKRLGARQSQMALTAKLTQRGVPSTQVQRLLEEEKYDEFPSAMKIAQTKWEQLMRKELKNPKASLVAYLQRKGYSTKTIHKILNELQNGVVK